MGWIIEHFLSRWWKNRFAIELKPGIPILKCVFIPYDTNFLEFTVLPFKGSPQWKWSTSTRDGKGYFTDNGKPCMQNLYGSMEIKMFHIKCDTKTFTKERVKELLQFKLVSKSFSICPKSKHSLQQPSRSSIFVCDIHTWSTEVGK